MGAIDQLSGGVGSARWRGMHLDLIDQHTAAIDELTARIEVVIAPSRHVRDLLTTILGISQGVADGIIAATGADMTRFPTAAHLASWAGTGPDSHESAGRVKSSHTRPGDPHLKGAALGVAAMSIAGHTTTSGYLGAKGRRVASRRGPMKALVAIERAILIALWNMITTNTTYYDLGADYFIQRNLAKHANEPSANSPRWAMPSLSVPWSQPWKRDLRVSTCSGWGADAP
jgi:transposase